MRPGSIETVCSFLTRKFRGARIKHQNYNDPQFVISRREGNAVLKVSSEFLEDTSEAEILLWFDVWGLGATLSSEKNWGCSLQKRD